MIRHCFNRVVRRVLRVPPAASIFDTHTPARFLSCQPLVDPFLLVCCVLSHYGQTLVRASYIYILRKRNIFTCHTTVYWHLGVYTLRDTGEWKGLSSMLCEKFSRKRDAMVQWDAIASKEELIDSHCSRCRHWHFNKSADL